MKFQYERLANNLQILGEYRPDALSTGLAYFVRTGARDESAEVSGVSHFLEHMAFKGTEERSGDDINRIFDEIGAKYNAYTSEEHTVYHASILPEYVPICLDVLGDLLQPVLRKSDFDTERSVIIEEIGMYADSPMWSAYDRVIQSHFSNHPLGNSILGTKESINGLSVEAMRRYHAEYYRPSNVLLIATGRFDWNDIIRRVEGRFSSWEDRKTDHSLVPANGFGSNELIYRPEFTQESIYLMAHAPAAQDPLRVAADVLAAIVGDDTGSRFYWELVDPGRVECIDLNYQEYHGAGAFLVGGACEPELASENLAIVRRILSTVTREGVTEEELSQAKSKLSARAVLSAERPSNRLFPVGYNWIHRHEYRTIDDELDDIAAVTRKDINEVLRRYPLDRLTTVCLGPLAHMESLGPAITPMLVRSPSLNRT